MITNYTITDTWQPITLAGQSGACWIVEFCDLAGRLGQSDVIIYHSAIAAPNGDEKILESKRLHVPNDNNQLLVISADKAEDVFYARCKTVGSQAKINVDVG